MILIIFCSPIQAQNAPKVFKSDPTPLVKTSFQAFQDGEEDFPNLLIYAEFDHSLLSPGAFSTLQLRCFIPEGWHLYSIDSESTEGPIPTRIEVSSNNHHPLGKLRESTPLQEWDEALEKQVKLHRNQFLLEQDYQIPMDTPEGIQDLNGVLYFQSCNNRICVPIRQQVFSAPLEIVH